MPENKKKEMVFVAECENTIKRHCAIEVYSCS